jgi:hypothetical protein
LQIPLIFASLLVLPSFRDSSTATPARLSPAVLRAALLPRAGAPLAFVGF